MTILSTSNPLLSRDIIYDMLSYFPVKSLLRFKCVCKHWNGITQDFQFICLHYKHAPLIIDEKPPQTQSNAAAGSEYEFKPFYTSFLVLEYATRPSHFPFSRNVRLRIRNPEIQNQILEIPDSQSHIWGMCIVFDPDYQVLKLLSFVCDKKSIGYEVLDLRNEESSYSWLPIVLNLPQQSQGETRMCNKQIKGIRNLFAMGTGYIVWDITVANSGIGIDILDTVNDRFIGYTTFPTSYYTQKDCVLWNGKLSFAKIVNEELDVLVLDFDYKKQMKWAERKLIIKLPFMRELSATILDTSKLLFWWKDKDKEPLKCFYDITTGKAAYPGDFQRNECSRRLVSNYYV